MGLWDIFYVFYHNLPPFVSDLGESLGQHSTALVRSPKNVWLEQLTVSLQRKNWYLHLWHLLNETQPGHVHGEACLLFTVHVTRKSIYFSLKNLPINYACLKYHLDTLLNHPCHFSAGLTFCAFHEGNIYVFNLQLLAWRILLSFMKWY